MGSSSPSSTVDSYDSEAVAVSGRIMMAAIVVLFMVVVFILILHIYARCCWNRRLRRSGIRMTRPRMEIVSEEAHVQARVGLDASVIQSIPVFVYSQKMKEEEYPRGPPECAVCLCEFEDKERGRLLPKCKHPFHVECIDMWLASHSTCPLCRTSANPLVALLPPTTVDSVAVNIIDDDGSPAQAQSETSGAEAHDVLPSPTTAYPTNVLFWGTENAVASASSAPLPETPKTPKTPRAPGKFVIDIPPARRDSFSLRGFSSPRAAAAGEDSTLSPGKSPSTRFRSIKRLLSRDKRMNNSPECSCTAASPSAAASASASASSDSGTEHVAVLPV